MAAWSGINSYTGQGSVGQMKDVKDILYYVEGNGADIQMLATYTTAKGPVTHYWEELVYTQNTSNTSQKTEGQDLTADTPPTKTEYSNYLEENAESYYVSTRQVAAAQAGAIAGVKDSVKEAKKQSLIQLKGRLEASLMLGEADAGSNASTPTPAKMNGLMTMALAYGSTGYITTASFGTASGEAAFKGVLATMRSKGGLRGNRKAVVTSFYNKDLIGTWTGIATDVVTDASKGIVNSDVKEYSSQFGRITLMGNDVLGATAGADLAIFDIGDLNIAWLQKTGPLDLGKTGLATKFTNNNICTLQYTKPSTLGYLIIS